MTLELKSSMQNTGIMFLIVNSTQIIPSRSEKLLQCETGRTRNTGKKFPTISESYRIIPGGNRVMGSTVTGKRQ